MLRLSDYFDCAYYINLEHRTDRRDEVEAELRRAGIHAERFDAIRPSDAGGFESIGAHGCFMSHLGVLEAGLRAGAKRLLVMEDDVAFLGPLLREQDAVVRALEDSPWSLAYLGHGKRTHGRAGTGFRRPDGKRWALDRAEKPFAGFLHLLAVDGEVLRPLVEHFHAILAREPGHPDGGPMHVDGAYARFQASRPELVTLISVPEIAEQRASHTDVHEPRVVDRLPVVGRSLRVVRRVRNLYRRILRFGLGLDR